MPERYDTESEDPISDDYRANNLIQAYKHTTEMLLSDRLEEPSVLEIEEIYAVDFKDFLNKLVIDKSFPKKVAISSSQINNPNDIADIYDSMSIVTERAPISQDVTYLKSGKKVVALIPVNLGQFEGQDILSVRIGQLQNMEKCIRDAYFAEEKFIRREEAIETRKNTESMLLRKSLEQVFNGEDITRVILMLLGESNLRDLDKYVKNFAGKYNKKNPKNRLELRVGEVEGDHHLRIILNELLITGGYPPEDRILPIYCMKTDGTSYVLFPYLDENLKLHVHGDSLANAGDYIKGVWYKQFGKKYGIPSIKDVW